MSAKRKRKARRAKHGGRAELRRRVAATGTVTMATLGLTTCNNGGGGVVDPPPPPPLVCQDASMGQNLDALAAVEDSTLTVRIFVNRTQLEDSLLVTDVAGATFDSLATGPPTTLTFTLETDTTTLVTFTLSGTFDLDDGPCSFTRVFTVTIRNGHAIIASLQRELPIGLGSDIRIEVLERDGLCVRLRARGVGDFMPAWRVTAGEHEPAGRDGILWRLPAQPGLYQVELVVDRGERGPAFDALSLEVT